MSVASLSTSLVDIEKNEAIHDGRGGYADSWELHEANVAVCIQPLSATEQGKWAGLPVIATHKVYLSDTALTVTGDMRIVFGARIFRVLGVRNPDELNRYLIIDCKEVR